MANPKCIVLAFCSFRETGNAFVKTVGMKNVPSSRKDFMAIRLMTNIPNQLIVGRIKNIMQSYGKLYHAKACAKMPAIDRDIINNKMPKLIAKLHELCL